MPVKAFKARIKPPIYTIIEVGELRTKRDLQIVNEELARAGSDTRINFERAKGIRVYALGHPYIWGGGVQPAPFFSKYIVVGPNRQIMVTNHVTNFIPID